MKKSIFIVFLLIGLLLPIPLVRATEPKQFTYFEYPTETWIIDRQDYFGQFLEWNFIPVDGQHSDKRTWNFTWRHLDYLEIYNETGWTVDYIENPVYRIRREENLTEIYGDIMDLAGFKNWGDFQSDVDRLTDYPIVPQNKGEIKGLQTRIDILNQDSGWFLVSFKNEWKPGEMITVGFGSTITYSAVTNTITCTGGTEGDPIDFWDLWNASDTNGWDVVNNTCDTQFKFHCHLTIGDGSIETWFADVNKQIMVDSGTASQIDINLNAHFQLGEIDGNNHTYNGCTLLIKNPHNYFFDNGGSGIKLYDSKLDVSGSTRTLMYATGISHEIIDCVFVNANVIRVRGINTIVRNLWIHGGVNYGFNPYGTLGEISNVRVWKRPFGIYVYTPFGGAKFKNLETRGITNKDIWIAGANDVSIFVIDSDLETWSILWATADALGVIYRQYTFNLLVVNEAGQPLENANVTLYEADDDVAFTVLTGADGTIVEQTVTRGHYDETGGSTLYDYGPHELVVSYEGMFSTTANITLSDPVDWTVSIEPNRGGNILAVVSIFLVAVVGIAMVGKSRW